MDHGAAAEVSNFLIWLEDIDRNICTAARVDVELQQDSLDTVFAGLYATFCPDVSYNLH